MPSLIAGIHPTTSLDYQKHAAARLSEVLEEMGVPHAYIGGFAWALLGSQRPTQDIDILLENRDVSVLKIRERLTELDKQFASAGLKFYYIRMLPDEAKGPELIPIEEDDDRTELVKRTKDSVEIETLMAGTMGLPSIAGPVYDVDNIHVPILHPTVLILTKLKRWTTTFCSTRPKTRAKCASDAADIEYMIQWMFERDLRIAFDEYQGKSNYDLLMMVRVYWDKQILDERDEIIEMLRCIMAESDCEVILKAQEEESNSAQKLMDDISF